MKKRSQVPLSKQDQQALRQLLQSGLQPVRTVLRALALRQLAEGQTVRQVARNVALTPKTVWLTRPTLSTRRPRTGALRTAPTRESGLAECAGSATHRRAGLRLPAGGAGALDRAFADRRGGETQTGAAGRARDHPGPARKPRPEAVAGKKCG